VIFKAHWVADYLHSVIEGTIPLDVDAISVTIADSEKLVSVIRILTSLVDLQFYPEISLGIAVEYGLRFVAIIVDTTRLIDFIMIALRAIVISVKVVGIVLMKQGITAGTASVVVAVAVVAEIRVLIPV